MEAVSGFLENLGALDALLLTLLLASCGLGIAQGFTAIVFTKLSILAGIWFAFFNGRLVSEMLVQLGMQQPAAGFAAPVLIVSLAGLIGWLLASSTVRLLRLLKVDFINRLLGGCYGFLRIAALILAATAAAAYLDALDRDFYAKSRIMQASGWTLYQIKESDAAPTPIREFLDSFSYDRDNYRPVQAASADREESGGRAGSRRKEGLPDAAASFEDTVVNMLDDARTLKDASDAIAGRQEAEADTKQETDAQRKRRWRRMSDEEIIAELQAASANRDEKLLEALEEEDQSLKKYLERFRQHPPDPGQQQ